MPYTPIQGLGGKFSLTAQIINPINMAVNLKNKWLRDSFFYSSFADLLKHGYFLVGTSTPTFFTSGFLQMQTAGTGAGNLSSIVTSQNFDIPNPLLLSNVFLRAIVRNRDIGAGARFAYIGFVKNSANNQITSTAALNAMDDTIGFVQSEDLNANNWFAMTQVGTTRTLTDTGIDSGALPNKKLEFRSIANGEIEFFIDNVVVATHSTNVPVGSSLPFRAGGLRAPGGPVQVRLFGISLATSETV